MSIIYGTKYDDNNTWSPWPYGYPYGRYYLELKGTPSNDSIYGLEGNDILKGEGGDDYLDGGLGADIMYGGVGNDTFIVNTRSDIVIENSFFNGSSPFLIAAQEGYDQVKSSVSYTLPANVEALTLTSSGFINGTGNNLNNVIYGSSGVNVLDGLAGNDTLFGRDGYDYLYGGDGNDKIFGEGFNDWLSGGAGDDVLIGGDGTDVLYGGAGKDRFDFESYRVNGGADKIMDFTPIDDSIGLDIGSSLGVFFQGLEFTANGVLNPGWYFEGNGFNGNGGQLSGIYVDTSNGYIWYNPTDDTSGDSYHFATVDTATVVGGITSLSYADFVGVHYHVLG